jgi:capsular exopolysaccharide synthesis family protein
MLRSRLFLEATQNRKCFLITSAREREGKSTVCASLGRVLARSGSNVLLIDGNLRNASLHSILGTHNQAGLKQVLACEAEPQNVIQTAASGLNLLASGQAGELREPLRLNESFERFVKFAKSKYDIVLIDSPPVLSWSDAMLLAPLVDGVVIVLGTGKIKAAEVRVVRERIELAGGAILGSVLNAVPRSLKPAPTNDVAPQLASHAAKASVGSLGLSATISPEKARQ